LDLENSSLALKVNQIGPMNPWSPMVLGNLGEARSQGQGSWEERRSQEPDKLGGDGGARSQGSQEEPGKLGRARKAERSQEALGPS
jgi:hypothetical protein